MGVIRYKIWQDLWANKGRTLQVVLIIGIGAFAIGMILTTRNQVIDGMNQSWLASSPPMIGMALAPEIDEDAILALERVEGIVRLEGYASGTVEWRTDPSEEWRAGGATTRMDFEDQQFAKLSLLEGRWPGERTVVVGQGSDTAFGLRPGDRVILRAEGRDRVYTIVGAVNDPLAQPPGFGGNAQFYLIRDEYQRLFETRDLNRILGAGVAYDPEQTTRLANELRDKLERQNVDSFGFMPPTGGRVVDPSQHFFQDTMDAIFLVLTVMAALALFLGLFLVYNTINAIISQQVDQIGVMKAIGASSAQILAIYLLYVFSFGLMALLIAIPLGALGGYLLNVFLLSAFNADPGPFAISWPAIVAQVIIALLAPLLVAFVPVLSGARVTVREAISTYGLGTSSSLLDRLLGRLKRISRLILLTVSNTFRHKGRVVLTQITLVLSGLIFMMVMSVRDSTMYTYNDLLFTILNSNLNLLLEDAERIKHVEALTRTYRQVQDVEMWGFGNATSHAREVPETDDDPSTLIFGVPHDTRLYGYQMRSGRWLNEGDTYSVVLNQELATDLGVELGDWVTFDQGVIGESDWLVVGLLFDPLLPSSALVPRDTILREQNSVGRSNLLWIKLNTGTPAAEEAAAKALRQLYENNGIDVLPGGVLAGQDTSSEIVSVINTQFRTIVVLLATMAVVIGVVGSISLSGVLALGVIERRREIGVMRAIGASSWDISRLFIGEGLILGWLSWLIALPLSLPAGRVMVQALSAALGGEIVFYYTFLGPLLWLAIITVLAALASWLPARRATHISVRESLAYL